jgi:hypothetical protein
VQAELELSEDKSSAPGNGTAEGAPSAADTPPAAPEAEAAVETEQDPVVQLINSAAGCFKVLESGERVALSDAQWRLELARHFKQGKAAGD